MPRRAAAPHFLTPARLDLDVYRGDTLSVRLQVRAQGYPINLTDPNDGIVYWEFLAYARTGVGGDVVADIEVVVLYPLIGVLQIILPPEQTQTLPGQSVWDLQTKDPVGRVRTVLRGFLVVYADITYGQAGGVRRG